MYPVNLTADERDKVQTALITGYAHVKIRIRECLEINCHHRQSMRDVVRNHISNIRDIDAALEILKK